MKRDRNLIEEGPLKYEIRQNDANMHKGGRAHIDRENIQHIHNIIHRVPEKVTPLKIFQ